MIVLQFIRGDDVGSNIIAYFGHGANFSHVDTVVREGLLGARSDSVGGAPPGVQIRDPNYVRGARAILRLELECSPEITQRYLDFVYAQIGKPYDVEGIEAFVLGRDWHDPDAWFCSEMVGAGGEHSGYFPYPLATPSNRLTPADLLLAISAIAPVNLSAALVPAVTATAALPAEKEPS